MSSTALPSSTAARDFLDGKPGSLVPIVTTTLGRAALIGIGLRLAGNKKNTFGKALAGALVVEAFVLYYLSRPKASPGAQGDASTFANLLLDVAEVA